MLQDVITDRIREQGGRITFAEYMALCLYHPEEGYYTRFSPKLGKTGDFYTSAHIGNVMGRCIAAKLEQALRRLAVGEDEPVTLIEWGGGDGRLAEAVLDEFAGTYPQTYERLTFLSVESSPYHRRLQRTRLAKHKDRTWGIMPPEDPAVHTLLAEGTTLLYANELLDAFPVHRLRREGGSWQEIFVEWDGKNESFRERTGLLSDPKLARWLKQHRIPGRDKQTVEIGLEALEWIDQLGQQLRQGFVLLIDYGDVSSELYASHRMEGTLMTYRNHTAGTDPYRFPGEQDMTSHVNFEWCMEAAEKAGFTQLQLMTQKQFLVEQGLLERLQNHDGTDPFSPAARSNRAIRQLLLGDGMSELFKVLAMYK